MFKKTILIGLICISSCIHAEIIEINQIDEVCPYVTESALCLFDIDDTLIDNPISLGSPPWRAWVKSKISSYKTSFVLYDALTLYIAKSAPYKTVEPDTANLINDLQNASIPVFAFTARGRTQWYTTDIEGVDLFTQLQLKNAGIDFQKTQIPTELKSLEPAYFSEGIIFAQHIKKGDLLLHLFKDLNYQPPLIIFVDDKLDQVQSVEAAVKKAGIPFVGFWYRRAEFDRVNFNPMIANIQLESLLLSGEIISDLDALEIAKRIKKDPQAYLKEILDKIDLEQQLLPILAK
jgi:hypothetical protein